MAPPGYASATTVWGSTVPNVWNQARQSRFGDIVLVLFLLAQCFDGILTYVGVMTFGVGIEGNPLIGTLMLHVGEGTALVAAKTTAAVLGIALHLRRVHRAVAALAAFYFAVAVLPWLMILYL